MGFTVSVIVCRRRLFLFVSKATRYKLRKDYGVNSRNKTHHLKSNGDELAV